MPNPDGSIDIQIRKVPPELHARILRHTLELSAARGITQGYREYIAALVELHEAVRTWHQAWGDDADILNENDALAGILKELNL